MFLIYGKRKARIKRLILHDKACPDCKSFDMEVKVYRRYFHVFFIPFLPLGEKTIEARCRNCTEPIRSGSLQKEVTSNVKTPFYLYSLPILFGILVIFIVFMNQLTQKQKARFVSNPKVGDVYRIRRDENNTTTYSFLRLVRLSGDTIFVIHNNLEYYRFTTKFNGNDYFIKDDEFFYTKPQLKEMLQSDEINAVERDYDDSEGFNRIQ
jgi:hypothetical protein